MNLNSDQKKTLRQSLEQFASEEGVDLVQLENFVRVYQMDGFNTLQQGKWARVLFKLLKASE